MYKKNMKIFFHLKAYKLSISKILIFVPYFLYSELDIENTHSYDLLVQITWNELNWNYNVEGLSFLFLFLEHLPKVVFCGNNVQNGVSLAYTLFQNESLSGESENDSLTC